MSYVEKLPTEHFHIIDDILSFSPLKAVAVRRVKYASLNDLESVFPFFTIPKEIIDRSIELYHTAKSFDEANKFAAQINLYASDFSDKQIWALLSKLRENDQILGSFDLPKVLGSIHETASKHSIAFDELLREHGLEEYYENTSDQDDEIPF